MTAAARRYSVVFQTLASIVFSILMTAVLMYAVLGGDLNATIDASRVWRMGLAISIIAPALIAPLVAYRTGRLLQKLHRARDQMEQMAKRDELTGLLNRRGFQSEAAEVWARGAPSQAPVGVLMCDIDRFKAINDRYGHGVGDLALRHVARLLLETARSPDAVIGRHGGEEFAILLPRVDFEQAREIAEAVRAACEANPLPLAASRLPVTLSLGVSAGPIAAVSLDALIAEADRGLYRAKLSGRNRVAACEAA